MLEPLGVDPAVEAIYLAMLHEPEDGITELAARLGWSTAQVGAALDVLIRLRLVRASPQEPSGLRPVAPAVGLEPLLAVQEAELIRQQHEIAESRRALRELAAQIPGPGTPSGPLVAQLAGLEEVRDGLERLAAQTEYEVLTFAPGGEQPADWMRASASFDRHLLGRGVAMRTLYPAGARNDPQTAAHAEQLIELGGQLRTVPVVPIRMLLTDRTWAVLPVDPERTAAGALVLRNPGISTALRALFDRVWQTGTPWGARQPADSEDINELERALLRLLSQGDTDEQAGRKLGVSTRTVGRIAADLMTGLGACSRFQAGALAVARGWLQPDFIDLPGKTSHKDQISHTASVDANSAADALGRPRSGMERPPSVSQPFRGPELPGRLRLRGIGVRDGGQDDLLRRASRRWQRRHGGCPRHARVRRHSRVAGEGHRTLPRLLARRRVRSTALGWLGEG